MTLCLFLRKEFGQDKFLEFMTSKGTEADLARIYGFENYEKFDRTFMRYINDLTGDVAGANKERIQTPDAYLQIREKP